MVLAELHYGIDLSSKQYDNRVALANFLQYVSVLDWPEQAGQYYGRIRVHQKNRGHSHRRMIFSLPPMQWLWMRSW
ncbi:type II toxin-antitoxin system VapC family toxin [Desulfotalea psychrophila]|uniref:Type II toxin-antitoxin system VapC family toxin n=1 Tax=Desulfotalea psychrophila TaxID=84980 RepID=A0ABS3AVW8_9BACT|nr:type II toxin-antitoxin system VapC family toxin [Desulfotalea psychrophila]